MKTLITLFACAVAAHGADTIDAFGRHWSVTDAADWKLVADNGPPVLRLLVPREPGTPRRPSQFALAEIPPYRRLTFDVEVKRNESSLILVFAWRDAGHFNYAHLSADTARAQPHHNGVFHVYGGERVRISAETGPAALVTPDWHKVRLVHDARTGKVTVTVDGKRVPSIEATDASLGAGRVGLGSFDETAQFRNVKINVR